VKTTRSDGEGSKVAIGTIGVDNISTIGAENIGAKAINDYIFILKLFAKAKSAPAKVVEAGTQRRRK